MLNFFGGKILNNIGGTFRWMLARISNKNKFSYKEYLFGPKKSEDHFDQIGHQFNNKWIGLFVLVLIFFIMLIFISGIK